MFDVTPFKSVVATEPHKAVSDKYRFINTVDVLQAFKSKGWEPSNVSEARVRDFSKKGFQKHLIRLRNPECQVVTPGNDRLIPEIVVINSHDRSAALQVLGGFFRTACANGLIVGTTWERYRIRHVGSIVDDVYSIVEEIVSKMPEIVSRIERFQRVTLSTVQQEDFAKNAGLLRWEEKTLPSIYRLNRPERMNDRGNSLWLTLNRVQEHLIKGTYGVRRITSIPEVVRINQGLWDLAEETAKEFATV